MNKEELINKEVVVYSSGMLGCSKSYFKITKVINNKLIGKIKNKDTGRYGRKEFYILNKNKVMFFDDEKNTLLIEHDIKINEGSFISRKSTGNFKMGFVNDENTIKEVFKNQLNNDFKGEIFSVDIDTREFKPIMII